jgi:flagellar biogenesis protein FliO
MSAPAPSPTQALPGQTAATLSNSNASQKPTGTPPATSSTAARSASSLSQPSAPPAAKPVPAKTTELIGSQAKPDILTGPDIGKDHTIDSPLQVVGEGWKMVAYLVPTLAFILICLNLMRRYQQKTGRLPTSLRSAGRDFGRPSKGIGSAFAGLLNFAKNSMSKPEPAQSIRLLESLTVGPGSLHLVQVRGRILLLSAGAAGMTVLTEFQEDPGAASDEFRSLLQSASADLDGLDMPGDEMPVSAVVGSLEEGMRETAEAMARRLRRLRMVTDADDREL